MSDSIQVRIFRMQRDALELLQLNGRTLEDFQDEWIFMTDAERCASMLEEAQPLGTSAARVQRDSLILAILYLENAPLRRLMVMHEGIALELEALNQKRLALREAMSAQLDVIEEVVDLQDLESRRALRARGAA